MRNGLTQVGTDKLMRGLASSATQVGVVVAWEHDRRLPSGRRWWQPWKPKWMFAKEALEVRTAMRPVDFTYNPERNVVTQVEAPEQWTLEEVFAALPSSVQRIKLIGLEVADADGTSLFALSMTTYAGVWYERGKDDVTIVGDLSLTIS